MYNRKHGIQFDKAWLYEDAYANWLKDDDDDNETVSGWNEEAMSSASEDEPDSDSEVDDGTKDSAENEIT
jgi:hypothetical protein